MLRVRLTTSTLCLVLVAAGVVAGQGQNRLTPTTAALRLTSKLEKGESDYERAILQIASSYWRHGDYESAFAQLENLKPSEKSSQLQYFASLAIKSGQSELARKALDSALKLVTSGDDGARETGLLRECVRLAVQLNDLDLASRFTDEMEDGSAQKAFTLLSLAEARATRNEKDKAVALLDQAIRQSDSFEYEDDRDELIILYTTAVKILFTLGEKDRASEFAGRANELFLAQPEPNVTDGTNVALSFARLGEFPRAMALLDSLDNAAKKDSLMLLAHVYYARGDETAALNSLLEARAIVESTADDDYNRSNDLTHLTAEYLRIGKPDEAFEVMREISNTFTLSYTANDVAALFIARKHRQEAGAVLDFAYARIRKIVSEKSEEIPGHLSGSDAKTKSQGLTQLGEKYLEIGDTRGAEAAALAIDHPQYKAWLLARVAAAYAKEGDKSKAKSLLATAFKLSSDSERYNHDAPREYALLKIAEAYADAGFKQESANAMLRLLREFRDADSNGADVIDCLIEVGQMAEKKGVPVSRNMQKMLQQVVAKVEDN